MPEYTGKKLQKIKAYNPLSYFVKL